MLTHKVSVIYLDFNLKPHCGEAVTLDNGKIVITINPMKVRIDRTVAHELMETLLQDELERFANYHLYEFWITSLEKEFFKPMNEKQIARWHGVILQKLVIKRR